jgi:hypothetical protein
MYKSDSPQSAIYLLIYFALYKSIKGKPVGYKISLKCLLQKQTLLQYKI